MVKRKGIKTKRLYKRPTDLAHTERHDAIHVWLSDETNRRKFIKTMFSASIQQGFDVNIFQKENEFTVYGYGNKYLVGIIDSLIFVKLVSIQKTYEMIVLCEFKPDLVRLSELLGQVRIYRDHINRLYGRAILPVLITFDTNKRFDNVLNESGIKIYRIDESETEKKR